MLTDKVCLSASLIFSIFITVSLSNPDITALLSFRASSDPHNSLASWLNSSDPCSGWWLGVACDTETRRVTRLVLENLNLTGPTRPLSQLAHLRHLSLKHNRLSNGPYSLDLSSWPNLKHLYLSHNSFAGEFPAGISLLRRLQRLDLSHNGFYGKIPMAELAQLPRLLTVRLELNSFDGELGAVNYSYPYSISDFNVSRNNLSGEIPVWLSHFDATSFGGNKRLCGKPLPYACSNPTDQKESQKSHKNVRGSVVLTTLICVAVAAVLAAAAVITACRWRNRSTCVSRDGYYSRRQCGARVLRGVPKCGREGMVVFDGCKKGIGGVSDLLSASAEMLGKGSAGTTYKVVMDGGDAVVVKRVREGRLGKEADWWLREIIGRLRHANIVSLRAYHRSRNHDHDNQLLLLVYDFLPNGSLYHLLHGNRGPGRTPLDWPSRLKLASDSARGLAFLHDQYNHNKVKLFHGHVTSSNIIIDRLGNACLSDVGLHQLLRVPLPPLGAYTAPELVTPSSNHSTSPRRFTHKCDVYSFGVVLLEILTGKMASSVEGETSMVKWAQSMAREEWTWEVLDVELLRHKEMEEQIMALAQVALLCLAFSPKDRPTMSVVHRMIEDIRTKGVRESQERYVMEDLITSAGSSSPSSSQCTPKFAG